MFWLSIGIGLAGGRHFSKTFLDLQDREMVTNLIRVDVSGRCFCGAVIDFVI